MSDYTETFTNGFDANQFNNSVLESNIVSTLISISAIGNDVTFTFIPALSAPDVIVFNAIVSDMQTNGPADIPETNVVSGINISNTTRSDDITSGALVVAGGMGIAKNLNVGGPVAIGDALTTELKTNYVVDDPASDTSFAGTGVYDDSISGSSIIISTECVVIGDVLYTAGACNAGTGSLNYFISAVDKTTGVHLPTYPSGEPLLVSGVASSSTIPRGIYDMGDGSHVVVLEYALSNVYDILLRRYDNTTGVLDTGYGNSGTVTIVNNGSSARAWSSVQQTSTTVSVTTARDFVNLEVYRIVLETGALDPSFGVGGIATFNTNILNTQPRCSAVQQDGSILCAGYVNFGNGGNEVFVTRFDIDGTHDASFSLGSAESGVYLDITLPFDTVHAIQIYDDNSICIVGYGGNDIHFVRLTEDGLRDLTFNGGTGILTLNPGSDDRCEFMTPVTAGYVYATININSFNNGAVIRLNEAGMDLTFAEGGYLDVQTGAVNELTAAGICHLTNDSIYVTNTSTPFKIAKFNLVGTFDIDNNTNVMGSISASTPTDPSHLTTKQYVDDMFEASDANITKIKLLKNTQSLLNNDTDELTWGDAEFNNGCTADSRGIIIVEPGTYMIGYEIGYPSGTATRASFMLIEGNAAHTGRRYGESRKFMHTSAPHDAGGITIVELEEDDLITVVAYQNSGSTLTIPASGNDEDINELYAIKLTTSAFPLAETTASQAPSFELINTSPTGATLVKKTLYNDDTVSGGSDNLSQEFKDNGGTVRCNITSGGFTTWDLRDTTSSERGTFNINTPAGGAGFILNGADTPNRKNFYTLNKNIKITHGGSAGDGVILLNGQDTWSTTSDQRLKENIVQCTGDLDKMTNIHGYCYNYIGDATERVGVIAQEVQAQYPIVVGTIEGVDEPSGLSDILAVKYAEMLPMLINTINELNTLIAGLKARLEVLESA
jgi:uncharacterized delta-60 repeat protein